MIFLYSFSMLFLHCIRRSLLLVEALVVPLGVDGHQRQPHGVARHHAGEGPVAHDAHHVGIARQQAEERGQQGVLPEGHGPDLQATEKGAERAV